MTHGIICNCMVCTIGKKVGLIKKEETSNTCSACGSEKGQGGVCTNNSCSAIPAKEAGTSGAPTE